VVDHHLPFKLDAKDPDFPRQCLAWASEAKSEIMELVLGTEDEIAASRRLMAKADRILARKWFS
jgi:hypothetical protein